MGRFDEVRRVIFIHPASVPPPGDVVVADAWAHTLARQFYANTRDPVLQALGPSPERTLCVSVLVGGGVDSGTPAALAAASQAIDAGEDVFTLEGIQRGEFESWRRPR